MGFTLIMENLATQRRSTLFLGGVSVCIVLFMLTGILIMSSRREADARQARLDAPPPPPLPGQIVHVGDIAVRANPLPSLPKPTSFHIPTKYRPPVPKMYPSTPLITQGSGVAMLRELPGTAAYCMALEVDDAKVLLQMDVQSTLLQVPVVDASYTCGAHSSKRSLLYNPDTYGQGYACRPKDDGKQKKTTRQVVGPSSSYTRVYTCTDATESSAGKRLLRIGNDRIPVSAHHLEVVSRYHEDACHIQTPPPPAILGLGVSSPFLEAVYTHFKARCFALYLHSSHTLFVANPDMAYVTGRMHNAVHTPWFVDTNGARAVHVKSFRFKKASRSHYETFTFEPPLSFRLSTTHLPAITYDRTEPRLYGLNGHKDLDTTDVAIAFRNSDKPLRKKMQPEGDIVQGNENILGIRFLRGMTTCINDTDQKHEKQTVTFLY